MQITSIKGSIHNIDTTQISMITGPKPADIDQRFYLHGLTKEAINVAGDVEAFVTSLPNASRFARLTIARRDRPFWVNGSWITTVHTLTAEQKKLHPRANATVALGHKSIFIMESPVTAIAAVNAAGGSL